MFSLCPVVCWTGWLYTLLSCCVLWRGGLDCRLRGRWLAGRARLQAERQREHVPERQSESDNECMPERQRERDGHINRQVYVSCNVS